MTRKIDNTVDTVNSNGAVETTIRNTMDVIDSNDVYERFKYLDCHVRLRGWGTPEERDELKSLRVLVEGRDFFISEFGFGEKMISDSYFTEYAKNFVENIGTSVRPRPLSHRYWKDVARELKKVYTPHDFNGVTYWSRNV